MTAQLQTKSMILGLLGGIVAGCAVTASVAAQICHAREAGERSKSDFATRAVIEDLDETLRRGDCKLAAAKTALFRKRWQEWIDSDAYPSTWFRDVVDLRN